MTAAELDALVWALGLATEGTVDDVKKARRKLRRAYREHKELFTDEIVGKIQDTLMEYRESRRVEAEQRREFGRTVPLDLLRVEPYVGEMPDWTP